MIGVPVVSLWSVLVVTVMTLLGVKPSPEMILEILTGSSANAPTISNSGRLAAKPSGSAGHFWSMFLPVSVL